MVVLGIDIGGTQIKAGMVDEKGRDSGIPHHSDAQRSGGFPAVAARRHSLAAGSHRASGGRGRGLQGHHQSRQHAGGDSARARCIFWKACA